LAEQFLSQGTWPSQLFLGFREHAQGVAFFSGAFSLVDLVLKDSPKRPNWRGFGLIFAGIAFLLISLRCSSPPPSSEFAGSPSGDIPLRKIVFSDLDVFVWDGPRFGPVNHLASNGLGL